MRIGIDSLTLILAIGVVVAMVVMLPLSRVAKSHGERRMMAAAGWGVGTVAIVYLWQRPDVLARFSELVASRALAAVASALVVVLLFWKVRSWFSG